MSEENTTVHFNLDPANLPAMDWAAFDQLTDADRHAAALTDPDAQPATEAQLARAQRVPNVRALRRRLNLGQAQFAHTFHLALDTVRDWEQGRNQPDSTARAAPGDCV